MKQYWLYALSSHSGVLYVGMTNSLVRRVHEHRNKLADGFTKRYNVTRLVHYEETNDVTAAIEREKRIKGWLRERKIDLVKGFNPTWRDLRDGVLGVGGALDSSSADCASPE